MPTSNILTPRESVSVFSWQNRVQVVCGLLQQVYEKYYVWETNTAYGISDPAEGVRHGRAIEKLERELLKLEQRRPAVLLDRRVLLPLEEAFAAAKELPSPEDED